MLIILEGPDAGGKTTLARRLAEELFTLRPLDTVEVRKCGPPTPNVSPVKLYGEPVYDYRPGTGRHVIYDRFHVGEWIYPSYLERASRADVASWRWLDALLLSKGALLVHATDDPDVLAERVEVRNDDLVTPDQVRRIHDDYHVLLAGTQLETVRYRAGDPHTVDEVLRRARDLESRAAPLDRFVTYVGPPRPRYLLLGDVRNELTWMSANGQLPPAAETRRLGPCFAPLPGTSGHYLLSHLQQSVVDAGLGLANACDVDDVTALRRALGWPDTVALGHRARRELISRITGPDQTSAFGAAPHPQFVRRFYHRFGWLYGVTVGGALREGRNELHWRPA